jgi:hypothetical protein
VCSRIKVEERFNIPILFLIFNRYEEAQTVFDQIKGIRPKQLFVVADGPRKDVLGDCESCQKTRKIIEQVDWDCEVKTLFRKENLGCGKSISNGISWFFDHVEQGIILEDDCVPDISFFLFCALMLKKYKEVENVMMIAGTSYFFNKIKKKYDYFFSRYYPIWGWATWRRAWKTYDFNLSSWKTSKKQQVKTLKKIYRRKSVIKFWEENFDALVNKRIDSWAFQWSYNCIFHDGFAVVPIYNLISNIGKVGVHTRSPGPFFNMPVKAFPVDNMEFACQVQENNELDKIIYQTYGIIKPFSLKESIKKIIRPAYHVIKRLR